MNKLNYRRIGLQPDGNIIIAPFKELTLNKMLSSTLNVAILDVETNGLDYLEHEIIEVGYIKVEVDIKSGKIVSVLSRYSALQEISTPLPELIIKKTGITDEMLKGQSIDWEYLSSDLVDADFACAFNSKFDRPFLEKKISTLKEMKWTCAFSGINWSSWDFPRENQESLCEYHGFYFNSHRALNDVEALAELMQNKTPNEDQTYFNILINELDDKNFLIIVNKPNFNSKNVMNDFKLKWEPNLKIWYKYLDSSENPQEIHKNLTKELVQYKNTFIGLVEINAKNKYKALSDLYDFDKNENKDIRKSIKEEKESILIALNTSYNHKDTLKNKGYYWDLEIKSWVIFLNEDEIEEEKDWLRSHIYENNLFKGKIIKNKLFKK